MGVRDNTLDMGAALVRHTIQLRRSDRAVPVF